MSEPYLPYVVYGPFTIVVKKHDLGGDFPYTWELRASNQEVRIWGPRQGDTNFCFPTPDKALEAGSKSVMGLLLRVTNQIYERTGR